MSWFSSEALAGLPGLPTTPRALRDKICRENWESRPRSGRGGGQEYMIPDRYLTPEFLQALRERFPHIDKLGNESSLTQSRGETFGPLINEDTPAQGTGKAPLRQAPLRQAPLRQAQGGAVVNTRPPIRGSQVANARAEVCRLWREYEGSHEGRVRTKMEVFCETIRSGGFNLPSWVIEGISTPEGKIKISRATLQTWLAVPTLDPDHKGRKDFFEKCPEAADFFEAIIASKDFNGTPGQILYLFNLHWEGEQPTIHQVRGHLNWWKSERTQVYNSYVKGDPTLRQQFYGSYGRGLLPNDRWEIDSTLIDLVTNNGQKRCRYYLIGIVDVATRQRGYYLHPTSSGAAVKRALADHIVKHGLPKLIITDNGKDYAGTQVSHMLLRLGVELKKANVRCPRQKPYVERGFGILQHDTEFTLLPGFIGHNVTEQQNRRAKSEVSLNLGPEQLQDWIGGWINVYHDRPCGGLGGLSPREKMAQFVFQGWVGRSVAVSELEFLQSEEEVRTLQSKGIMVAGKRYLPDKDIGLDNGTKVIVRYREEEPNQISIFWDSGKGLEFLSFATWEEALTQEEQAIVAVSAQRARKAIEAQKREELKKYSKSLKKTERLVLNQLRPGNVVTPTRLEESATPITEVVREAVNKSLPEIAPVPEDPEKRRQEIERFGKPQVVKRLYLDDADFERITLRVFGQWKNNEPIEAMDSENCVRWCTLNQSLSEFFLRCEVPSEEERKDFWKWIKSQKLPGQAVS